MAYRDWEFISESDSVIFHTEQFLISTFCKTIQRLLHICQYMVSPHTHLDLHEVIISIATSTYFGFIWLPA
jgi:hypothetical protein